MSRRKKRKDGKPSFTPPPTPHDIFKAVDRHGDLLARDLSDLRERGMMGPHMRVEAIPTRVYQAIQREARCGFGNGEPYYYDEDPSAFVPYGVDENVFLTDTPQFIPEWLDTLNLNLHGNRVYHYTDAIVQWMLNTRLNIPAEELRLPFPSLMLTTRSETLVRVFLGPKRQKEYTKELSLALVLSHVAPEGDMDGMITITTYVLRSGRMMEWANARIVLSSGFTIGEAVSAFAEERPMKTLADEGQIERTTSWFDANAETYYRTVINCISYVTTPNPAIGEVYEQRPGQVNAPGSDASGRCKVQDVGRGLEPIEIRPSDIFKVIEKGRKRPGSTLAWRVLVAGHWRAFPYQAALGPLAQRNWIKPFWRGQEDAPERNKPYNVDKGKEA